MPGSLSYLSACDTSGYSLQTPSAVWDVAGIYSKIQDDQVGNSTFFPDPYNYTASSQANTVYGQLDRKIWYKGIQWSLWWGQIETAPGVFDFTVPDKVLNTIRDLNLNSGRSSAVNKKVQFLLSTKSFSYSDINKIVPSFRLTANGFYPAPYDTVQRYNQVVAYTAVSSGFAEGHLIRLQDHRLGLTGNDRNGDPIYTMRNAFMGFITAINDRYKDHPAFGGIVTTESTPTTSNYFPDPTEFNRDLYYAGRLQWLKDMKGVFLKHLVAETCNFDVAWVTAMTADGALDGLATNRISFLNPNYHTGLNLRAIYNARDFLDGIVPIINSCQGLDQDSKSGQVQRSGANNDIWDWTPERPNHGNPTVSIENPGYVGSTWTTQDPPNFEWVLERAVYLKSNIFVYQHNYAAVGKNGSPRYNWPKFVADMDANTTRMSDNTGLNVNLDPAGGMITTRPLHLAGD